MLLETIKRLRAAYMLSSNVKFLLFSAIFLPIFCEISFWAVESTILRNLYQYISEFECNQFYVSDYPFFVEIRYSLSKYKEKFRQKMTDNDLRIEPFVQTWSVNVEKAANLKCFDPPIISPVFRLEL